MKNIIRIGLVCLTTFTANAQSSAVVNYNSASDLEVMLQAVEMTTPMSATDVPFSGTFYSAQHAPGTPNQWPPMPINAINASAWSLGDENFLLDDLNYSYDAPSLTMSRGGMRAMDDSSPSVPGDGSGGGGVDYSPMGTPIGTTNQLWLQILSLSNSIASLVIHPPAGQSNGVYDLYYTTNLVPPVSWQWLLRTEAGQTNLTIPNATDALGFYDIRPPSDLAANDSLGTNFWTMFLSMYNGGNNVLSLNISSPLGATGTVTLLSVLTNGPVLYVTNCGDTNVNGTYILTNMTAQEQMDWTNSGWDVATTGYQKGTNWAGFSGGASALFDYDATTHVFTALYYKAGYNLNGTSNDWLQFDDPYPQTPTTICPQGPLIVSFTVAVGAVTNIIIPLSVMTADYDVIETNGIHIVTDNPVSVYGLNYVQLASAAFTAYPVPLLGTNYCLLAYPGTLDIANGYSVPADFSVVAVEDNTTVWITPSPMADLVDGRTNAYSITLTNQGQTYQNASVSGGDDVTGTRIISDKPIAIFAGAYAAYVPTNTPTANPLVQEQLPVEQWGMQGLAMSLAGRTKGDTYRVLAANDDTIVWTNGVMAGMTNAGQHFDFIIDGPVEFQASQPIQVAQFANGRNFDFATNNPNGYQEGDPSEILLPPTGHYLMTNIVVTGHGLDFSTYPPGGFDENFLNVIVPQSAITNTLVDGSHITTTNFLAIGTSGYYGAQVVVTNGTHTITSSEPLGIEVYGFGYFDAYGYFGGIVK